MFEWKNGELFCEQVPVKKIADEFGTPVYIYSRRIILDRISLLKRAFSGLNYTIAFSLKANNNPHLLRLIMSQGLGADTVSKGEVKLALDLDFPAERIVFAGVGKRPDEIQYAVEKSIKLINVESEEELHLVEHIARRSGKRINVALRVNPDVSPDTIDKISTARKESKFGIELEKIQEILAQFRSEFVRIVGLHIHIGSQIFEWQPYREAFEKVRHLLSRYEFQIFDIGGGFGVDYEGKGREFDFRGFRENVLNPLSSLVDEIITEPGRYIIARAGILLTKVLYRKRNFIIVDAGMNDFSRPAYYGAYHRIDNVTRKGREKRIYAVGGPVCESTDVFGSRFELETPDQGELLAIMDTGAYGMSMASNYNARPRPPEVLCDGENLKLIRKRESLDEILWKNVPWD